MKLETYVIVQMLNEIFFENKVENIECCQTKILGLKNKFETYVIFTQNRLRTHFEVGPSGVIYYANGNLETKLSQEEIETHPYLRKSKYGTGIALDIKKYLVE